MIIFVYILRNANNKFYVGMAELPEKRLKEHNSGKTKTTRGKGPWEIVHTEQYPNRIEARAREKFLKSGIGRAWIKSKFTVIKSASDSNIG
jgi:putative endonuclease